MHGELVILDADETSKVHNIFKLLLWWKIRCYVLYISFSILYIGTKATAGSKRCQ